MRATNIILQGLPVDIYSPVNHHIVAKDLWERVQLLIQGTSLTKQERECKLYDAFDKFTHIKGRSLHTYYLRFTQLINDVNIYKMNIKQFQMNTKFLNSLSLEWDSSFVVPVFYPEDDLIAYLNKAMVFLTAVASSRQCTHPKQPRNTAWYKEKAMLAEPQEAGQIMEKEQLAFLADPGILAVVLMANISNYGSNVISEVLNSETYLNDMDNQSVHALQDFEQSPVMDCIDNEISSDSNIIPYSQYLQEIQQASVQDTSLQAQHDSTILSVIEQMINLKAQRIKPTLYDGIIISKKHVAMHVIDNEETLILEEESRSKMSEKEKDPKVIAKKISHKPINYEKLNRLTIDFGKPFTPQQELLAEQAFWLCISNPTIESSLPPVRVEVLSELPKVDPHGFVGYLKMEVKVPVSSYLKDS
nr:retrovirus-related Pol polyprotein from transposon TNT 1-94 [Tanacetum cinerariifolium]